MSVWLLPSTHVKATSLPPPDIASPVLGEPYFYDGSVSEPGRGEVPAVAEPVRAGGYVLTDAGWVLDTDDRPDSTTD